MEKLNLIHQANFRMLKDIEAVCKKNNIRCFLDYGTLLGAVRHKDFIPWDDDIDLVVLREDYSSLIKACKKELPETYQVVEYTDFNGFFYDFISRIEIKGSFLHLPTETDEIYENKNNRVCTDIFILDKAPESKILFLITVLELKFIYLMAMGHRYKLNMAEYSLPQSIIIQIFSRIGKLFSLKTLFKWHLTICLQWRKKKKFSYMKNNALISEMNFMFPRECYEKSGCLKLRDHDFTVPAAYDKVLKILYNDYMKLPPADKQKPLHCQDYYIPEEFFN